MLRDRCFSNEIFDKFVVIRDFEGLWVVVAPGEMAGAYYDTWDEAIRAATTPKH